MIRYHLPNPGYSTKTPSTSAENTIIFASTSKKYYYPSHFTPYLLLANFQNTGSYKLNNRQISINDKSFYFLNTGDKLEINFRKALPIQTFMVLFNDQFVTDIINACQATADKLLDDPFVNNNVEFSMPAVPFFYTTALSKAFNSIRAGNANNLPDVDLILSDIIVECLKLRQNTISEIDRIDAKRKSTREELYKRIILARAYMEDNDSSPLTLSQIAGEACLNKFHFLKLFKSYYGTTPHQFLIDKKLNKALTLIQSGDFSVSEICQMIGFESLGSFSNLFKKRFGVTPSKFGVIK